MATSDEATMLRGVLDESHDGLLLLDEHGAILEANTAAAALLGVQRSALDGRLLADLLPEAERQRLAAQLAEPEPTALELRLRGDVHCTTSLRALPGTTPRRVAVAISVEPARTDERLEPFLLRFPYAVVALHRNLRVAFANDHARALLGAAAVRTGATFGDAVPQELRLFAQKVSQASAPVDSTELSLEDDRVFLVSGLAPAAGDPAVLFVEDATERHRQERVLREFLRNAAHQLRTPVAGITAAIEMLQAGAKESPVDRDRFLTHVEQQAERLRRVARGVLQLARSRAGEAPPIDLVELRPLIDRLVQETEPHDGIELVADCPDGLAALAAPDLLHEALAALLDNAFAHAQGTEVRISAEPVETSVLLTVTDHGSGILPEHLDRVFEPFFRASPSGEGYGLGLAIAAQAIETMGGEIDVSSRLGTGTAFTVKLPAATVMR